MIRFTDFFTYRYKSRNPYVGLTIPIAILLQKLWARVAQQRKKWRAFEDAYVATMDKRRFLKKKKCLLIISLNICSEIAIFITGYYNTTAKHLESGYTYAIVNISSRNSSIPRPNLIKYLALNWKWILASMRSIKYSAALIHDNEAGLEGLLEGPSNKCCVPNLKSKCGINFD